MCRLAEQRGVVGGFNSRGRLTPLKGGRLEGWRGRGIQSGVEGIRRWGLVPLLESKDLFSINKVAVWSNFLTMVPILNGH